MAKKQNYTKILFLFLFIISLIFQPLIVNAVNDTITIKVDGLNLRSGPGLDYSIISSVHKDEKYAIIEEKNGWYKIKTSNSEGWVAGWLVQTSQQTINNKYVEANSSNINVRTGPSMSFSVLERIQPGAKYSLIEEEGDWAKIQLSNSRTGWVAKWVVTISETTQVATQLDTATITADILNVRSGPSTDNTAIGKLYRGDQIKIVAVEAGWYKIVYKDTDGWIASEFTSKSSSEIISNEPSVTILNPGTNLREGPSTSYPVVGIANIGEQFPIIATKGDWYQIQLPDGKKAYVAGWIVSVTGIETNIEHGINGMLKNRVIVIDAGHGGRDYGATGINFNSIEKELNLSIALILQKKLEATGAKVVMTRTTDTKISLQQRVDSGIYNSADIFISIHHNTNSDHSLNGTITYYYKDSDKRLAQVIHNELIKYTNLANLNARHDNYFVLRENPVPSILIELAFITNYHDELKVSSSKFQENAAEGIFQGILKYFNAE